MVGFRVHGLGFGFLDSASYACPSSDWFLVREWGEWVIGTTIGDLKNLSQESIPPFPTK